MLSKFALIKGHREGQIVQSGRKILYSNAGITGRLVNNVGISEQYFASPVYAFGKWFWFQFIASGQQLTFQILQSTNGESWTVLTTLFTKTAPASSTYNTTVQVTYHGATGSFFDGYITFNGWYRSVSSSSPGTVTSGPFGFIVQSSDGINWSLFDGLNGTYSPNYAAYIYGNLMVAHSSPIFSSASRLVTAKASENYANWTVRDSISGYAIAGGTTFFKGNFYLYAGTSGSGVLMWKTSDFASFTQVPVPAFTGRAWYANSPISTTFSPETLWAYSIEGTSPNFTLLLWKTSDGVNWESSSLPSTFYQGMVFIINSVDVKPTFSRIYKSGNSIFQYYRKCLTNGTYLTKQLLYSDNFSNFIEYPNGFLAINETQNSTNGPVFINGGGAILNPPSYNISP